MLASSEYLFYFLEHALAGNYSGSSLYRHLARQKRLAEFLIHHFNSPDVELTKLTNGDLEVFLKYNQVVHEESKTASIKFCMYLKEVLNRAIDNNWVDVNPVNIFTINH
jgi:hypothetical protein